MSVAVVVVNHGSSGLLADNLVPATSGLGALVVVVDNSPGQDEQHRTAELCRRHGWQLVTCPNDGFGAGVNRGVSRAAELGAEAVLVLNPDLTLGAASARTLLDAALDGPPALIAPTVVRPDGTVWFSRGTLDLTSGRTRSVGHQGELVWLSGACLAFRVTTWELLGGFDPRYFLYWEDVDLGWRARHIGVALVVREDVVAVHAVGGTQQAAGSRRKSDLYYRENCRGRLVFAAHHLDPADRRRWMRGAPAYARDVVLRGGRRQLLAGPGPVLAALRGTVSGLRYAAAGARHAPSAHPRHVVLAHPSPDLYGSDLQLLESVRAAVGAGWRATLVLPAGGPLTARATEAGAGVRITSFPVLRKALLHPRRVLRFLADSVEAVLGARRWLRTVRPDVLYVNTLTIPTWQLAGRLAGVPVLVHVHEAEEDAPWPVRAALTLPLLAASRIIANSATAARALADPVRPLARRTTVLYNGVPGPEVEPAPVERTDAFRLLLVGRLSPRKGTDVALEAVADLVRHGYDVRLRVAGSAFAGYEWFEDQLRTRIAEPDLVGRVELLGYVAGTGAELAAADAVLVPSRVEPFGNTAVEALLARRPLVASATQGLMEIVRDGETGLLVPPGDAAALARAVARLVDDVGLADRLADQGHDDALRRFGVARYAEEIRALLAELAQR